MPKGVYKRIKVYTRKPMSEETKLKISLANKGRIVSQEIKEKIRNAEKGKHNSPNTEFKKGYKMSKETKRKMSKARKGNKSHFWKGGITPLARQIRHCYKYRQWRSDIFTRDDFTCQKCLIRGGYLEAHHIKSFSIIMKEYKIKNLQQALDCDELWNINNGITLCKKCHNKTKGKQKTLKNN